ncbi:hypothetical protein KDH_27660 [Dictyobacter sp. S3.2.2.5]|uniref:Insecticide toxin TcdB middle/N-terminal domain-containing protein n=1 Tax=Dictyobacter halimunensis TaxID=3026934 RepID=A0ABQ6FSB6_9CHLR|nr:hypothetical protein KDH_27660 [Dictyobacter sp. S3.2.2.5]
MNNTRIAVTPLSLPKGGGAIQGIGETFQADAFTGTASLSIPVPTSPCRDFEPRLSIDYDSGSGNGPFGMGFGLAIATISRKTSKGLPRYDGTDTFLLSSAEDLVPVPDSQREETRNNIAYKITAYRPRLEGLFATIEYWTDQQRSTSYWRVVSNDNTTSLFGTTENSKVVDPENPDHVFQWLLAEMFDARGNHSIYEYTAENNDNVPDTLSEMKRTHTAKKYIKRISYGNMEPFQEGQTTQETWHFEVVFDYGEYNIDPANATPYTPVQPWTRRLDAFSTYQAGFEIRTHRLCRQILMFHRFAELGADPLLVHATRLHYQEAATVSLLQAVESIGYRYENGHYQTRSFPLLEFTYTSFQPDGHSFELLQDSNGQFLPGLNRLPEYQLVDLYGEGIPGVLYSDGNTTRYWEPEDSKDNQGMVQTVRYAPTQAPFELPIESMSQPTNLRLLDLTGSGQLDLLINTSVSAGYYEAKSDHTWEKFRLLPSFPSDFSNPYNYLVDMTGDGLADLLFLGDEQLLIYPSLGTGGFGTPLTRSRRSDIALPRLGAKNEVLQFADLFGSGMSHLVRITNGKVECWPNLGYGQFGNVVLMDNAPHFGAGLDASRLFLADLDGSGTADIIYAYPDHVEVFFNQSGNSFSSPLSIPLPGAWDRINDIELVDVFGSGTMSLLLSENHPQPRHWCYDFSQGQKPYLLQGINNHLGAQSTISYCSSTRYYLEDKQNNLPWIVNLPFPVQVVAKTETIDLISQTRLVSTYAYHHGYYDGIEREFRGFGLVERWDAETLSSDAQATDVPPVLTRTWYHTGAWEQDSMLSQQYQHEYSQHDTQAYHLPANTFTLLADDADARREAYRALKGQVLRQEISSPTAPIMSPEQQQDAPYSVTDNNYAVTHLQARGQNRYGVYFVHAQESLTYAYERNPHNPRVNHSFILKVDDYGNILNTCAVTYGRRQTTGTELPEQLSLKVVAGENSFINQTGDDIRLLGVPQENKTYEITGLALMSGQTYVTIEQIGAYLNQVAGTAAARLLSWQRHYYWSPEQKLPYPLGQVSSQALLAHTEEAVFSSAQAEQAFAGALTNDALDALLAQEGGYQLDPTQMYWWNPGLSESYLDASQFFLPSATTDPYGHATSYTYDSYNLLPVKVTDALNNQMTVQVVDYQALTPQQLRDSNGNISEVLCDPLGMVVVSSFYGMENGQAVGFMQLKDYQLQVAPGMNDVIANPQKYLQGASSYFYYDLFAWDESQAPAHAVNLLATNYPSVRTSAPIQISISYSDGLGRAQQSTMQVEAGLAHVINPDGTITEATANVRWLTSGRTVYNNKGNPVKQYEPYYIASYQYVDNPHLNMFGVSPTLFYNPLGRLIRVETAKGFLRKTEFTPWIETFYDEDDTIEDSTYYKSNINNQAPDFQDERQALQKAAMFYNTPTTRVFDNLGRVVLEIQQAGTQLKTHYEWDIQGNQLASADPRLYAAGKENFRMSYTMTGVALKTVSADVGTRWQLSNVIGNPIYSRDARDFELRVLYDALNRPTTISVQGGDGSTPINQIVERMVYGESLDGMGQPVVANPEKMNLRGQLYQRYDQAGVLQNSAYSITGQPLQVSRQLRQDYKQEANWNDVSSATLKTLLQPTSYQEIYQYDSLGRVTAATNSDGNISEPTYHLSGRLNQIQVRPQAGAAPEIYVQSIDYSARNQRQSISYGNGVTTSYAYEPTTFRLTHILTTRLSDSKKLQDLSYTYDPVGNITHIVDAAQEPVFNANQQVNPASDYTYDALYRLIAATGREHPAISQQDEQQGGFNANLILPLQPLNNGQALQNYSQQFTYDDAGNLYSVQHQGANNWTYTLTVSDSSNRAVDSQLTNQSVIVNASFDGNGNQIQMPGLLAMAWNYRNNIASVTVIARQNAPSDGEYYVYDGTGNRVRKVSEQYGNGGTVAHIEETLYLGSLEIRRITQGSSVTEERHSLRVLDGERAVTTRITWTQGTPPAGAANPQLRYQLDNHLGSATLEVDANGQIISYEEYFPYGGTALVAGQNASEVELKQYRYSGKERDSMTGFYYYGARYYAPWLGRWMSPDPLGTVDGPNLYVFVGNNPITSRDGDGRMITDKVEEKGESQIQPSLPQTPPNIIIGEKHTNPIARNFIKENIQNFQKLHYDFLAYELPPGVEIGRSLDKTLHASSTFQDALDKAFTRQQKIEELTDRQQREMLTNVQQKFFENLTLTENALLFEHYNASDNPSEVRGSISKLFEKAIKNGIRIVLLDYTKLQISGDTIDKEVPEDVKKQIDTEISTFATDQHYLYSESRDDSTNRIFYYDIFSSKILRELKGAYIAISGSDHLRGIRDLTEAVGFNLSGDNDIQEENDSIRDFFDLSKEKEYF